MEQLVMYRVGQKSDTSRTYITLYERYHFFGPPGIYNVASQLERNVGPFYKIWFIKLSELGVECGGSLPNDAKTSNYTRLDYVHISLR